MAISTYTTLTSGGTEDALDVTGTNNSGGTKRGLDVNVINTSISVGAGFISQQASASAVGSSIFRDPALSNTAVAVKASAGNLYGYHIHNSNTDDAFVQIYDVAQGSVTVGTTTPLITLFIPANSGLDLHSPNPIGFTNAITVAATTTITGGLAPSTALLVQLFYK